MFTKEWTVGNPTEPILTVLETLISSPPLLFLFTYFVVEVVSIFGNDVTVNEAFGGIEFYSYNIKFNIPCLLT